MKKTITLNEMQMKLLKEYQAAADDSVLLAKQCEEIKGDDPFFDAMCIKFDNACAKHDKAARVFAASFVAGQGPQVNPVGTAGEAATAV